MRSLCLRLFLRAQGTIHYVYDPVTNLLIETWTGTGTSDSSSTTETSYSYTAQGQLHTVSVIRQDGATVTGSPTTTNTYDADGNVIKIAYPNGTETDYDYTQMWNASGGIETVSNWRGGANGTLLSSFVYTFNTQRQKVQSVEYVLNVGESASTTTTINWTYDSDGHLTDEVSTDGVAADIYHDHYDYDAAGNRIQEYIALGSTGTNYTEDNFYFYNADGQLTIEADDQSPGPRYQFDPTQHQHQQYLYDDNGSLKETDSVTPGDSGTTVTPQTMYGYDARNRLASMTNVSSGVTTTYAYNDGGDRVGQTTGSSETTYVVDNNNPTGYSQVVETWTGGGTPAVTYEEGLAIISQTVSGTGTGSGTQYIMPDGHGSTRQLTAYTSTTSTNGQVLATCPQDELHFRYRRFPMVW